MTNSYNNNNSSLNDTSVGYTTDGDTRAGSNAPPPKYFKYKGQPLNYEITNNEYTSALITMTLIVTPGSFTFLELISPTHH